MKVPAGTLCGREGGEGERERWCDVKGYLKIMCSHNSAVSSLSVWTKAAAR